jgi:ABC-type proline/glycine betaine transport system substrate-binding protein
MQSALDGLEKTYFTLQTQLDMLGAGCQTQAQRDALMTQYVQARQNYWACVNRAFHDEDPEVAKLTQQIQAGNQQLSKAVEQMGDISKTIDMITNVVNVGTALAGMALTG